MELGLMTKQQVADELQIEPRTLDNWHTEGKGPKRTIIGRLVRYKKDDVMQWIDEQGEK